MPGGTDHGPFGSLKNRIGPNGPGGCIFRPVSARLGRRLPSSLVLYPPLASGRLQAPPSLVVRSLLLSPGDAAPFGSLLSRSSVRAVPRPFGSLVLGRVASTEPP